MKNSTAPPITPTVHRPRNPPAAARSLLSSGRLACENCCGNFARVVLPAKNRTGLRGALTTEEY